MPQTKTYSLDGRTYTVPADASMDEVQSFIDGTGQQASPTTPTAPPAPKSLLERVTSYLPSPRTTLRVGGGIIGGAIGGAGGTVFGTPIAGVGGAMLGGAAGQSIGESIHQLGSRAMGYPAPSTPVEASDRQVSALLQGAMQEGAPALIMSKLPGALRNAAANKIGESVNVGNEAVGVKREVGKVAGDVIGDFPISATSAGLLGKLETKAAEAVAKNEAAYQTAASSGLQFKSEPIAKALEHEIRQISHAGAPIPAMQSKVGMYQEVVDWLRQHPTFTVEDFRRAKKAWDSTINHMRAGQAPDPARTEAVETAANVVRSTIHKVFPAVAKTDRETHVWSTLVNVLQRSVDKGFGKEAMQQLIPRSAIGGSAGAGIAMARGDSPYEGALLGATLGALTKTTAWNTLSVRERAVMIRAIESEFARPAAGIGSALASGGIEEAVQRPPR